MLILHNTELYPLLYIIVRKHEAKTTLLSMLKMSSLCTFSILYPLIHQTPSKDSRCDGCAEDRKLQVTVSLSKLSVWTYKQPTTHKEELHATVVIHATSALSGNLIFTSDFKEVVNPYLDLRIDKR